MSILNTDSYKLGHPEQYPDMVSAVAYAECRRGGWPNPDDDRIVLYGLRYHIEKYLSQRITSLDVEEAADLMSTYGPGRTAHPFPIDIMKQIVADGGYFPVTISALPEGSVIYPHVPVYQIEATDKYSRLITYLETALSRLWYSINVATLSRHTKSLIQLYFDMTVDPGDQWLISSRLHDFGARGCTCEEQAIIGGSAHALSFSGSDTLEAAQYVRSLAGYPVLSSIPATEHSVMTSWPTEVEAVNQMVNNYGSGLFATVADSYNYSNYLENVLPQFVDRIRELGGTIVVRPDSGNPVECVIQALDACWRHFGGHVNSRGYRVLHNCAVIQGDGINYNIIKLILEATVANGFSVQNVAFGMGAGLLHNHKRDTLSFATKLCEVDGRPVMKHPSTDMKKWSLPGKLQVTDSQGAPKVKPYISEWTPYSHNRLQTIYDHGAIPQWDNWKTITNRLDEQWADLPAKWNPISTELYNLQQEIGNS